MGRPRGFDEERAVAAAADLFARRSYDGTSVDDLVNQTGVHRGSLYKTFGSKRGLYLAALRHYVDHDVTRLAAVIAAVDDPGRAVRETVTIGAADGRLGFLFLAAAERAPTDPEVAAEVFRALRLLDDAVLPVVTGSDAAGLAEGLTAISLGLLIRGHAAGEPPQRATDALITRITAT